MDADTPKREAALPPGTALDRYRLGPCVGGGGFSLVYRGEDVLTGQKVVIKEFMPSRLARRTASGQVIPAHPDLADRFRRGRRLFLREASTLARLHHPNIVRVLNFFGARGTIYMVMLWEAGENLQRYLHRHGGRLSERFLRTVFPPLLDGLEAIHLQDLLHLDIKPGNIHIRPGGRPLLLDFGAVHGFPQSRRSQPGQVLSPGFSPSEQYQPNGYVGPWSDIYALGATLRACIEGRPPLAADRRYEGEMLTPMTRLWQRHYTPELLRAIDRAMELDPLLRPQSVAEFRQLFPDGPLPAAEPAEPSRLHRLVGSLPWKRS